jgi:hypothetical protein
MLLDCSMSSRRGNRRERRKRHRPPKYRLHDGSSVGLVPDDVVLVAILKQFIDEARGTLVVHELNNLINRHPQRERSNKTRQGEGKNKP